MKVWSLLSMPVLAIAAEPSYLVMDIPLDTKECRVFLAAKGGQPVIKVRAEKLTNPWEIAKYDAKIEYDYRICKIESTVLEQYGGDLYLEYRGKRSSERVLFHWDKTEHRVKEK